MSSYDILGHSWGGQSFHRPPYLKYFPGLTDVIYPGMIASNFAAARQSIGLRRLILANCPASTDLVVEGVTRHIKENFPPEFYEIVKKHEDAGTTGSMEYKDLDFDMQFAKKHTCTMDPWPAELLASFAESEKDKSAHKAM